ncbi:MAG: endonuclease III domain-containing protein [Thermoproteus sp.]|jgi:endonuclease-3
MPDVRIVERVAEFVKLREDEFVAPVLRRAGVDVFELLVAVVLTQNTTDRNAFRAYYNLKNAVGRITPQALLSLGEERLAELIRPAGMHRVRARKLIELSRSLSGVDLSRIADMDVGEARRFLTSLPGVGEKTADVVLANLGKPAFPVDTHIARIARRWGIGKRYGEISRWFMERLPPERYLEVHLKLIQFGRDYCKARSPRCRECPVSDLCPWPGKPTA